MEALLYQSGPACRVYLLAGGSNCPAEDFLTKAATLHPDEFAKLTKLLDHSCDHGLPKNKQKVNTLGDGLFEFKTIGGLRLIWFWDANRIILCTHGFLKKRQTTPSVELSTAAKWKKAYGNRKVGKRIEIYRRSAMKPRLTALKAAAEAARQTDAYRAEGASIRFTEDLVARMKVCGLTRSALAEKIGSSPAYVTKILRGDTNFTLDSMVKIAAALGCELTIGLQPLATAATAMRRSTVSYRDAPPLPSPMLNDQPQD